MRRRPGAAEPRRRFEELYSDNHDRILGYVLRRTESPDDAADAMAETFLTAWRRIADVPPADEARLWLYGVARRVLANQRRERTRRSSLVAEVGAQLRVDLAGGWDGRDTDTSAFRTAFQRLPETDRELLSLVAWEELDHGQIATVLGCSRNAVRIRLHRARRRLAHALDGQEERHLQSVTQVPNGEHA